MSLPVTKRGRALSLATAFGAALFLFPQLFVWRLSLRLAGTEPLDSEALAFFLLSSLAAGGSYLLLFCRLRGAPRLLFFFGLGAGALLRVLMFFSTPILETDFYRYLWDGGVAAHGFNPYRFTPVEIRFAQGKGVPLALRHLGQNAPVLPHVNHPELTTIYPPIAQAFFALSYWIEPWGLMGWRGLLALCDLVTALLLWRLLGLLAAPPGWILIYWCNPLLIKEIYNTAHMDMLLFPFLAGTLLAALRGRPIQAFSLLAAAAGVKIWPLLLAPLLSRFLFCRARHWVAGGLYLSVLLFLIFLPQLLANLDDQAGLSAYARKWEMNDGLFMLLLHAADRFLAWWPLPGITPQVLARWATALVVGGFALACAWRKSDSGHALIRRSLWIVALLFFLSPTQFPWYWLWMLPLLTLRPSLPLLLYTPLLFLYYARDHFEYIGDVRAFDNGFVWRQHVPVLGWLGWEAWRGMGTPPRAQG